MGVLVHYTTTHKFYCDLNHDYQLPNFFNLSRICCMEISKGLSIYVSWLEDMIGGGVNFWDDMKELYIRCEYEVQEWKVNVWNGEGCSC